MLLTGLLRNVFNRGKKRNGFGLCVHAKLSWLDLLSQQRYWAGISLALYLRGSVAEGLEIDCFAPFARKHFLFQILAL